MLGSSQDNKMNMEGDLKIVGWWETNEDWRFTFGTRKDSNIDLPQVEDIVIDLKFHDYEKKSEALKELYP